MRVGGPLVARSLGSASVVIEERPAELAVRALYAAFVEEGAGGDEESRVGFAELPSSLLAIP